jgi:hypothetical protein
MIPEWNGHCHRCGKKADSHTMSYFNTDLICESCDDRERNHPMFAKAQATEEAACRDGNFNFPGIGKPADL